VRLKLSYGAAKALDVDDCVKVLQVLRTICQRQRLTTTNEKGDDHVDGVWEPTPWKTRKSVE